MPGVYLQIRYVLPLWFIQFMTNWLPDNRLVISFRGWLAHFFIKECGRGFQLGRDVTLLNTSNLTIGKNVYIAKGAWLNAMGGLCLKDEVVIAPYVVISTLQHVFKNSSVRFGGSVAGQVTIGKGSWLAAHSSVKCGVTIGDGNLVAANSFVVKSTPNNKILSGVPAQIIKDNEDGEAAFFSRGSYNESK